MTLIVIILRFELVTWSAESLSTPSSVSYDLNILTAKKKKMHWFNLSSDDIWDHMLGQIHSRLLLSSIWGKPLTVTT